jgi:trehalose 6-phosphate phosphatase
LFAPGGDRPADIHQPATTRARVEVEGLPSFWSDLAAAATTALLLDYDGTLAPFALDRMSAMPMDGVTTALERILTQPGNYLSIISGRPAAEIRHLLGDLPVAVIGSHGWETAHPGALAVTRALLPARAAELDAAEALARTIAGDARTERKHASVAVHVRRDEPGVAAQIERELREAWSGLDVDPSLTVRAFNGGLELRVGGWDKGTAVAEILEAIAPDFAAYLGDDDTDEDAFRVVGPWGVGIRVGGVTETAASGRITLTDVPLLLHDWASCRDERRAQT